MKEKPPLSPEQDRAANPANNIWVQANAGTGKTSVLVERLLRILFRTDDIAHNGILCLTYTKAGAGEMRNRILKWLREWALASDEELVKLLRDVALHKPATAADIAHAREVFFWYIDNPETLKIKTIHSFCEEILHRFPIEAGISPAWTMVLDENQRVLQLEAFERLLRAGVLEPEKYGRVEGAFARLVNVLSEYRLSDFVRALGGQYEHFFLVEDVERYRKYFVDTIKYFLNLNTVPQLEKPASELEEIIKNTEIEQNSRKTPAVYLSDIITLTKQYIDKTIDFDEYKYAYLLKTSGMPNGKLKKHDFLIDEMERVFAVDQYNQNMELFNDTMALFDLSAAFATMYRGIKQQRNLLDFEDLVLYTRKLFSRPDVMGWVLSQLDVSLSHILVDEAQDTSPLHWDVLTMMLGDFFVNGDTKSDKHSLFIVGDPKQAIFGFQGADFHAFSNSFSEITRHIQNNLRTIQEIPLEQSFRSLSSILYVVDEFFNDDVVKQKTGFHNNSHFCHRKKDGMGLVELHRLVSNARTGATVDGYIDMIADKIKSMIDSGERKPSDIMVLVQRRKPLANLLVTALKKRDIDVAGSDRIYLPMFPAIRDLMNLVRFCINTADDYSLCCVLKSPIFRLSEADIFNLCKIKNDTNNANKDGPQITVFEVLGNTHPDIYNRLKSITEMSLLDGPYTFFSRILDSGVRHDFISALGPQAIDPLEEFMTMCLSYERTQPGTMRHFLKWFVTGGAEIKRDVDAASGVRVVTAHGSKGLEAPVVFLIDTTTLPKPESVFPITPSIMPKNVAVDESVPSPWIWQAHKTTSEQVGVASDLLMNDKLEEYYRLLYVAMTRARDELYIYGYSRYNAANEKSWYSLLWDKLITVDGATVVDDDTIRIIHDK